MMRFDRFTERDQEAAQRAAEIIQRYGPRKGKGSFIAQPSAVARACPERAACGDEGS